MGMDLHFYIFNFNLIMEDLQTRTHIARTVGIASKDKQTIRTFGGGHCIHFKKIKAGVLCMYDSVFFVIDVFFNMYL